MCNSVNLPGSVVLTQLRWAVFAGNTADKLAFKNFLAQFQNLVSGVKSSACKLASSGELPQWLPSSSYQASFCIGGKLFRGLDLLKSEFLDLDFIKSQIFA